MGPALLLAAQLAAPAADEPPASHRRMLATLAAVAEDARTTNPYFGRAPLEAVVAELAKLPAGERPKLRWRLERDRGFQELRLGSVDDALASYGRALELCESHPRMFTPRERLDTLFDAGLAHLRAGETANCVAKHCKSSCIFPIRADGVHGEPGGSRRALQLFRQVLERAPEHPSARWLANVAAMTLGEHPDGLPEGLRIALDRFAPGEAGAAFPRFVDVAQELGLDAPSLAGGVVADDFDGDGVLDLVNTSWGAAAQVRFWKGLDGGRFEDRTREANLSGITGGLQLVHADYDGDGDLDLLVLRGAWMRQHGRWPNSLLANDGAGRFVDVTYDVGLAEPAFPTQTAAWGDYDGDGDLDLYVGNESSPECAAPSQLFRNDGGEFVDVAAAAGVTNDRYAKGVAWGDVDGDRRPDLYVSNNGQANRLYRNRGDGTFEDVTEKAGVGGPIASFSTWFFDYDGDGALDLFVAGYFPFLEPFAAWAAGLDRPFETHALYRGDGHGGFADVTREVGLARPVCTMGSGFGDFDDDGFLDLYLATGYPGYEGLMPNVAFWNRGGRFVDVTVPSGMGHLQKGHGVAFLDYDGDGDLDVYEDLGGAFPGDAYSSALFRNPGSGHHWIEVELRGTRSNRFGLGARIRVDVREGETLRSMHRVVSAGSSFGGNPFRQHVGVGRAERIERLEVHWPTSDLRQTFRDLAVDRRVRVVEGEDELRPASR